MTNPDYLEKKFGEDDWHYSSTNYKPRCKQHKFWDRIVYEINWAIDYVFRGVRK